MKSTCLLLVSLLFVGCADREGAEKQAFFEKRIHDILNVPDGSGAKTTIQLKKLTSFQWKEVCFSGGNGPSSNKRLNFYDTKNQRLFKFILGRGTYTTLDTFETGSVEGKCFIPSNKINIYVSNYRKKVFRFEDERVKGQPS